MSKRHSNAYAHFVFTLPAPLSAYLHQQARYLLIKAGIDEPVTWEPPFEAITDITWPGPHPDDVPPQEMWALIRSGLPLRAIATRLGTTIGHLRLTASRHPAPPITTLDTSSVTNEEAAPAAPDSQQLRAFTEQGLGPRKIAQLTGCGQRRIQQLLIEAGITQTTTADDAADQIDPDWLRDQYETRHRSLKTIAADLDIPVPTLATQARKLGITIRPGVLAHQHPLTDLGGPDAFPPIIWFAFSRPAAEQRIRRFLQTPGHPTLGHAAKHLGIRTELLASQITQLEQAVGAALLRLATDRQTIRLTPDGEQFSRDVRPVLDMLDRRKNADNSTRP